MQFVGILILLDGDLDAGSNGGNQGWKGGDGEEKIEEGNSVRYLLISPRWSSSTGPETELAPKGHRRLINTPSHALAICCSPPHLQDEIAARTIYEVTAK